MSTPEHDAPPGDKRMTLSEHLEELRTRVVRSLIALCVALLVTMTFQIPIMKVMIWPHDQVMQSLRENETVKIRDQDGNLISGKLHSRDRVDIEVGDGPNKRIVTGMRVDEKKLFVFGYTESFFLLFKMSLIAAAILASPVILYQIWRFVGVGLYPNERRLVYTYGPVSFVLFALGVLFGFMILIPISLRFLAEYALDIVDPLFNLSQYFDLVFFFTLALGAVFELPLAMHFAGKLGLITSAGFAKHRRIAIVLIVIAAAILTPTGDPYTLLLVSVPMYGLYELGILFCRLSPARLVKNDKPEPSAGAGAAST
jgi:sec-independent protein translocase protein TatC